ncbi:MAG: NAD(P)-binding protein, partial [Magnetococcales bacterium]|nr:NAD(P)-binding protein [Magnetococcales bacterium]
MTLSDSQNFDAIIIGAGLGGLVAGALLTQGGKRVQLLERHDKFGGAATTFRRRDLQVEVSLCLMDGLDIQDFKTPLFSKLGVARSVPMATASHFYRLHHPLLGAEFIMPRGYDAAIEACTQRFPQHAKSIRIYFTTIRHLRNLRNHHLLQQFKLGATPLSDLADIQATLLQAEASGETLPPAPIPQAQLDSLWSAQKISMSRFLNTLFGSDEAIKFALCANLQFFTSSLEHISLFDFSLAQGSYHYGAHYIHEGSQKLSDQLVKLIRSGGGEVLARREVTRILMDDGHAVGVVHRKARVIGSGKPVEPDPRESHARLILGNATPRVIRELLPAEDRSRFYRPYDGIAADLSNWTIYLGFSRPPAHYGVNQYAHFIFPAWLDTMQ